MREILFRGKRADNGEWVEGFFYEEIGSFIKEKPSSVTTTTHLVIPETVGQFTGLTDKNGKKIFEGDVISGFSISGGRDFTDGVVGWSELFVGWRAIDRHEKHYTMFGDTSTWYEVTGNVHDNPELLPKQEEEEWT